MSYDGEYDAREYPHGINGPRVVQQENWGGYCGLHHRHLPCPVCTSTPPMVLTPIPAPGEMPKPVIAPIAWPANTVETDRLWCRAICEEIGERPDLIEKIMANYNRQRAAGRDK